MMKQCTKTHNVAFAAPRRPEYLYKKRPLNAILVVLAEICKEMDDYDRANSGSNDFVVFQVRRGRQRVGTATAR